MSAESRTPISPFWRWLAKFAIRRLSRSTGERYHLARVTYRERPPLVLPLQEWDYEL